MRSTDGFGIDVVMFENVGLKYAQPHYKIRSPLFREEARVFLLLDARTEVAALVNDDIILVYVYEIKDDEERAERCSSKDLLSSNNKYTYTHS